MEEQKNKKIAIGYVRVSTKGQATEGLSLDAQIDKIQSWAKLFNYELKDIYMDAGISGKTIDKRAGLIRALDEMEEGQTFIFYSLSRLTRSIKDMLRIADRINKQGVNLVSITEQIDTTSAAGRMVFNILGVMNQFESEQVSERTHAVIRHKRELGELLGNTKFGYKIGEDKKTLEPIPHEREIIELITSLRDQGYKLQEIADQLNRDELLTRQGKKWKLQYVHNVLKAS